MRLEVLGEDTISPQARTYAEYRLFAALSQVVDTTRVRRARMSLARAQPDVDDGRVSCTIVVDIEGRPPARFEASGTHPYAAINRAVARMNEGMGPRVPAPLTAAGGAREDSSRGADSWRSG